MSRYARVNSATLAYIKIKLYFLEISFTVLSAYARVHLQILSIWLGIGVRIIQWSVAGENFPIIELTGHIYNS